MITSSRSINCAIARVANYWHLTSSAMSPSTLRPDVIVLTESDVMSGVPVGHPSVIFMNGHASDVWNSRA